MLKLEINPWKGRQLGLNLITPMSKDSVPCTGGKVHLRHELLILVYTDKIECLWKHLVHSRVEIWNITSLFLLRHLLILLLGWLSVLTAASTTSSLSIQNNLLRHISLCLLSSEQVVSPSSQSNILWGILDIQHSSENLSKSVVGRKSSTNEKQVCLINQ